MSALPNWDVMQLVARQIDKGVRLPAAQTFTGESVILSEAKNLACVAVSARFFARNNSPDRCASRRAGGC
jgi:hypothetical protein